MIKPLGIKLVQECERTEKRIRSVLAKWDWIVSQRGWKFDVHYCLRAEDMPEAASSLAAGYAYYDWKYLKGDIYFNLAKARGLGSAELEELVVHELTHLLVAQGTFNASRNNMERTVTETARVLISASYWQRGKRQA